MNPITYREYSTFSCYQLFEYIKIRDFVEHFLTKQRLFALTDSRALIEGKVGGCSGDDGSVLGPHGS